MNIPIYRAKKIQSDEYGVGYYTEKVKQYPGRHYIHFNNGYTETYERIDPKTLAIHFKDMVDSEGNKIFASLSEDGKGGDICDFPNHSPLTAMRNTMDNDFDFGNVRCFKIYHMDCEVIGIQE